MGREVDLGIVFEEFPELHFVMVKEFWFRAEGEIALKLYLNKEYMYAIAFTLGKEEERLVAWVGAIQGSKGESRLDTFRDMTKRLHGIRPRDLMVEVLRMISRELAVTDIYAISNAQRHHAHPYFGKAGIEKVKSFNYDEVWIEHQGQLLDNGFYSIPVTIPRRKREDIPARKRTTYQRRYQLLDRLALDIHRKFDSNAAS
jgi:uncharacterized protein VirK/YbjX